MTTPFNDGDSAMDGTTANENSSPDPVAAKEPYVQAAGLRGLSWDDLPKQPWPEATEPPIEALADWLLSLSREQFLWLLDKKRMDWSKDSDCFIRDHEGRIAHAEQIIRQAADHWQRGYDTGFEDAKTRALEVLHDHK